MQKALHFTIPLSAGIGALFQFSFDFSIDRQIFLIADGMLKACPEVHMISFRELLINAKNGDEKANCKHSACPVYREAHPTITLNTANGCEVYTVMAAFYSQVYNQEDTGGGITNTPTCRTRQTLPPMWSR